MRDTSPRPTDIDNEESTLPQAVAFAVMSNRHELLKLYKYEELKDVDELHTHIGLLVAFIGRQMRKADQQQAKLDSIHKTLVESERVLKGQQRVIGKVLDTINNCVTDEDREEYGE